MANSNAWYHLWVDEAYIEENLTYVFNMLKDNTDETLWNSVLETYETYQPVHKGGPLMLYLILQKLQSSSETALRTLEKKVRDLKIKNVPGEDVDHVISLIKNTYKALVSASTDDRNYVPDDFPQTVYKVLQTTSCNQFNAIFREEERKINNHADKFGCKPVWPPISQILTQAANSYTRLRNDPQVNWHVPSQQRRQALNANQSDGKTDTNTSNRKCFNCDGEHLLPDCPKP